MTYLLIHGAGDSAWYWHLVLAELERRGRAAVAVDLPCEDESAHWSDYADAACETLGERSHLVVVAQSLGGYTGPLVCARKRADLLVLIAAMIPRPGESAGEYWANTRYAEASREVTTEDPIELFYHDVPRALAKKALRHGRRQAEAITEEPWPLAAWPTVPVKFLLCQQDRMFPADWLRNVVRDRLHIEPDEIDTGHCPALAHPKELVDRLEAYRSERTVR